MPLDSVGYTDSYGGEGEVFRTYYMVLFARGIRLDLKVKWNWGPWVLDVAHSRNLNGAQLIVAISSSSNWNCRVRKSPVAVGRIWVLN